MKIGTDIIQINRIERSLEKFGDKFKMKFLNSDEILEKNSKGAPSFSLREEAQKIHQIKDASLSISHDAGFAIAVVVINQ
ncbi:MAG: hypothetical protein B6D54_02315 [Epsilonproteobacteria bacterium 4484_65]|nr:MAG: hypothetical protein B6D54_02315 [Epsilonproteobacteria bacterium 4484_65]